MALLAAINALLGAPDCAVPLAPLTENTVEKIAAALQEGAYQPAQWFSPGAAAPLARVSAAAPAWAANARHSVVLLPVEPSGLVRVSKRSGGVVYEDPFYAVLACFNLGYLKKPLVEVRASSREQAWSRRPALLGELARGEYRPERYFSPAGPALGGGVAPSAHGIAGEDMERLVFNGMAEARLDAAPARLYRLYRYEAPSSE